MLFLVPATSRLSWIKGC